MRVGNRYIDIFDKHKRPGGPSNMYGQFDNRLRALFRARLTAVLKVRLARWLP